jgi:hypothetical protein
MERSSWARSDGISPSQSAQTFKKVVIDDKYSLYFVDVRFALDDTEKAKNDFDEKFERPP